MLTMRRRRNTTEIHELARFDAEDAPELVAAAFACPYCLYADMVGTVQFRRNGAEVACRCLSCTAKWTVRLDPSSSCGSSCDRRRPTTGRG